MKEASAIKVEMDNIFEAKKTAEEVDPHHDLIKKLKAAINDPDGFDVRGPLGQRFRRSMKDADDGGKQYRQNTTWEQKKNQARLGE